MHRSTSARARALAAAPLLALALFAGCGDDDPAEPGTTTATTSESVDAAAFKDCILNASVDRGVYEEVPSPSADLQQAGEDAGAEFFEAGKADDGLVLFYTLDDPAGAEQLTGTVEGLLDQLAATLAEGGPKEITLGGTSVETAGPIVVGLLPFSADKEAELSEETLADVSACAEEAGS